MTKKQTTLKQAKWSDEFDEKFANLANIIKVAGEYQPILVNKKLQTATAKEIKQFISTQIHQAQQQERARVREMIEGMKKMKIEPDWDDSNWAINDGYNTAIQDLLEKLNESK